MQVESFTNTEESIVNILRKTHKLFFLFILIFSVFESKATILKEWDTSTLNFNGSSEYLSLDNEFTEVQNLTTGTIYTKFQATGTLGTLFSISSSLYGSSEFSVLINGDGTLRVHAREKGVFINDIKTNTSFNDNLVHKAAVVISAQGTKLFVDGQLLITAPSSHFFNSVSELNTMSIGRNVDQQGGQWFFKGKIYETQIHDTALDNAQASTLTRPDNVIAHYYADLNITPEQAGWVDDSSIQGTGNLVDDAGQQAWFVNGSNGRAEWQVTPSTQTNLDATTYGWTLSSTFKVKSGSYLTNYYANGSKRFLVNVMLDSNGDLIADVEGDTQYTLVQGGGDKQYHDYQIIFNPRTNMATFTFNSIEVTTWTGSQTSQNVIVFGNGSTGISGTANYKSVSFKIKNSDEPITQSTVFEGGAEGINGMSNYRIPSLIQSGDGSLLAFIEGRPNGADPGANGLINISLKRSLDKGKTWLPVQILEESTQYDFSDPRPVIDKSTNTIFVFYTQWQDLCAQNGNCAAPGDPNYLLYKMSQDNGVTWSDTINVSASVKDSTWRSINAGPGHGIQLNRQIADQQILNGRMIFPAIVRAADSLFYAASIYSDDNGATWLPGELTPISGPTEADIVELVDGKILLSARNDGGTSGTRYHFLSTDGGISWQQTSHDLNVSRVDIGITRFSAQADGDDKNQILVSGPIGDPVGSNRQNLGIWISEDEGLNFNTPYQLVYGHSAYSDIITLEDGSIAVIYEATGNTLIKYINLEVTQLQQ